MTPDFSAIAAISHFPQCIVEMAFLQLPTPWHTLSLSLFLSHYTCVCVCVASSNSACLMSSTRVIGLSCAGTTLKENASDALYGIVL